MSIPYSMVLEETCHAAHANITIIVQGQDVNVTRVIHQLCSSAVRRAIGPLDARVEHEGQAGADALPIRQTTKPSRQT